MDAREIDNILRDSKKGTRSRRAERSEPDRIRKRTTPYIMRRCSCCNGRLETAKMMQQYGKRKVINGFPPIVVVLLFRTCRRCDTAVQDRQLRYINKRERMAVMARLLSRAKKENVVTRKDVERLIEALNY